MFIQTKKSSGLIAPRVAQLESSSTPHPALLWRNKRIPPRGGIALPQRDHFGRSPLRHAEVRRGQG